MNDDDIEVGEERRDSDDAAEEEEAEDKDDDDNEEDVRNDWLRWVEWGREIWCTGRRWDEGEIVAVVVGNEAQEADKARCFAECCTIDTVAVAVGCDPAMRKG